MVKTLVTHSKDGNRIFPVKLIECGDIQMKKESKELEIPRFDGVMARDLVLWILDNVALNRDHAGVYVKGKTKNREYDGFGEAKKLEGIGRVRYLQELFFLGAGSENVTRHIIKNHWNPDIEELSQCMYIWSKIDGWGDLNIPINNLRISRIKDSLFNIEAITLYDSKVPPGNSQIYGLGNLDLDLFIEKLHEHEKHRKEAEKQTINSLITKIHRYEQKTGKRYIINV